MSNIDFDGRYCLGAHTDTCPVCGNNMCQESACGGRHYCSECDYEIYD